MQRYRINYLLLGALFLGCILIPPPLYFVWKWRVEQNAAWFQERGEAALAEGDLRQAAENFTHYIKLRRDEDKIRIQLAHVLFDISETIDVTREELGKAYSVVEDTVVRTGDPDLRRKLIDFLIKYGRSHDAIGHIDELLLTQSDNHELKALRAKCLFLSKNYREGIQYSLQLIGYDKQTDTFDEGKAQAKDQPDVYSDLAGILYAQEKKLELAERVIQQMIDMNPESHVAHLRHSVFLYRIDKKEESEEALAKAYELDPTDAEVLLQKGMRDFQAKRYEEASKIFADALEKYPEHLVFYRKLAETESNQQRHQEAIEVTEKGISFFGLERAIPLQQLKIKILLSQKDFSAAEEQLQKLADLENPGLKPLIDFERARMLAIQEKWVEAEKALRKVRPQLHAHRSEQAFAGIILGTCYERLRQPDQAKKFYLSVLQDHPNNPSALAGLERIKMQLSPTRKGPSDELSKLVQSMMEQPEKLQDWESVTQMIEARAAEKGFAEAKTKLLHARVMVQRKKFAEAKEFIVEALQLDPENLQVVLAAIRLIRLKSIAGPDKAMTLLDKKIAKMGDHLEFRRLRADLLMSIGGEQVPQQLLALTEGMEEWSDVQQAQLWSTVGLKLQQLNKLDESRTCWTQAAELLPDNLPIQLRLFEVALAQNSDEAMREAQRRILTIVDKNDSNYILTEVKRRIVGFGRGEVTKEEVREARKLLDATILQRSDWHELHVLYGQLLVLLKEDSDLALKHFEKALQNGPPNLNAVSLQIRLLSQQKRFAEAAKLLDLVPLAIRPRILGRLESDVLLKAGEKEAGFLAAQRLASAQPKNPSTQAWFANIAKNADKLSEAEAALQLGIEVDQYEPRYWLQLVGLYIKQQDNEAVERTLREAHLALDAEHLPLLTAKSYELRGQWQDAERLYLSAYDKKLEDIAVARKLAAFYLLWVRSDETNRKKAAPYINRILKAANEGRVAKDQENVVWARRQAARLLAESSNYQDVLRAQKLLEQGGSDDGQISSSDRLLAAEMHMSQRDPTSQLQAIALMSELLAEHQLSKSGELQLARLLHRVGQWERCKAQMLDMLSRYGADAEIWATYITMLIDRDEHKQAAQWLERLEELRPQGISIIQLKAALAASQGDKELLRRALQALLPQDLRKLDKKKLAAILSVAKLSAQLDDQGLAEQLYRLYAKQVPEQKGSLIGYLATYGNGKEALDEIKRLGDRKTDADLKTGLNILRRRKEFGDKFDDDVLLIIRSAIREDPDSARRQLLLAEALEVTEDFDQSSAIYQQLLQKEDVPEKIRAPAMNNLAFLYALEGQHLDEAEQLVEQAIEIVGPISAMLDTRAIVWIARERYDSAIQDMKLAVMVGPNAAKYFHLAQAQLLAGNSREALAAWDKAIDQGLLEENSLHPLEKEVFEELSNQMEGVRSQNAGL